MYFADVEGSSGTVENLEIVPLQIRNFRLVRPLSPDIEWLQQTLDRESRKFGGKIVLRDAGQLAVSSSHSSEALFQTRQ
jgi:poly-gamma-glutamate capsule biosynthesis protein CapA/YwtB (metallophosphatase superfamily)